MSKQKNQIIFIHGSNTFRSKKDYYHYLNTKKPPLKRKIKWSDTYLDKKLGKNCEIIRPAMPLKENARYKEWKITFETYLPHIKNNIIFIGSSLGGIFLAKYLSENKFSKKILSTYLICPPFDNSLPGEDLVGGFTLKKNLTLLEKNSPNIYLMFSKDDDIVPVSHSLKYQKKLKNSKIIIFKSKKGHFKISKFPELVKMIKKDLQK